ncbi:MAG: glycosyltransferase [Patescibacteria group bacterium]
MITIVLPVYNEDLILQENAMQVFDFCRHNLQEDWQIVISDNASDDKTREIGEYLAGKYNEIKYFRLNKQGKGEGVIGAWQNFKGDVYVFMDIDLSVNLKSLPALIDGIKKGDDIVIGSRMAQGSQVNRSFFRTIFSYGLRFTLRICLGLKVKDAPCGFKAINNKVVEQILPRIQDKAWFFDTEMLFLAQRQGFRIKEIPVDWEEVGRQDRHSKVGVFKVVIEYIRNIHRLNIQFGQYLVRK